MSYDTVKDNLAGIIKGQGYKESTEATDMEDVAANDLGFVFIINAVSGSLDPGGETLGTRFYDDQVWEIKIGIKKSGHNQIINRDNLHRRRVKLIREIDEPANWLASVRIQKYQSWVVEEVENYFLLTISVQIVDLVIY